MKDLTKPEVISLLALHGYTVPEPDLTEIMHRANALIEALQHLDALDLYHVEPWPVQPSRSSDRARG